MSRPLNQFWQALEIFPDLAAVASEWQAALGTEYEHVRPLLLPTPRLAGSIKSTVPGRWCVHQIKRFKGDYLAVCPDGCDTVTLSREDIVVHKLDLPVLCRQVSEALGLESRRPEPLPQLPKAMNIGAYVPYGGRRFDCWLAMLGEPDDLVRAVDALVAGGKPFILLLPTRSALTQACAERIGRARSSIVALAETLGLDDRGWLAMLGGRVSADLFTEFRTANNLGADRQADGEFFPTPAGAQWGDLTIVFKDAHTVSVSVGRIRRVLNYSAMGMASRKNRNPNKQWELLYKFALGNGQFGGRNRHRRSGYVAPEDLTDTHLASRQRGGWGETMRKQKQLLAKALQQFFKIDGDPFVLSGGGGWNARFIVTDHEDRL